jgi:F-box-like
MLPPEICNEILKMVPSNCFAPNVVDRNSLQNCSLMSKRWNELARPFIFRTLALDVSERSQAFIAKRLDLLHNILDHHPTLASCFRHIVVHLHNYQEALDYLKKWGERIVGLTKRLPQVSHFIFDPTSDRIAAPNYYREPLFSLVKEAFKPLFSLPSMQYLDAKA